MVAHPASTPPAAPDFSPDEDPPSSARYGWTVDQDLALFDPENAGAQKFEIYAPHESLRPRRLTRAQRKELAIKQTALRITAGLESRSLRTLARLIGCSHQAIDKAVLVMCERIGLRKFHVPDSTRQKLKAARARQLAGA